ncbi:acylamino-acid-releasing enzyme [Trichonephila clavipes]|nr:acylamino-acid-releasing enzyme [Trichonephila clavipes]
MFQTKRCIEILQARLFQKYLFGSLNARQGFSGVQFQHQNFQKFQILCFPFSNKFCTFSTMDLKIPQCSQVYKEIAAIPSVASAKILPGFDDNISCIRTLWSSQDFVSFDKTVFSRDYVVEKDNLKVLSSGIPYDISSVNAERPVRYAERSGRYAEKRQEETKNELKDRMEKGLENVPKCQEELKNSLEEKIDSIEEKIALQVEEKISVVEEKMKKKVEEEIERIK